VRFIGAVVTQEGHLSLVTELMDFNLKQVQHKLSVSEKIRVCRSVAEAM
jgi:hypothetical protein